MATVQVHWESQGSPQFYAPVRRERRDHRRTLSLSLYMSSLSVWAFDLAQLAALFVRS